MNISKKILQLMTLALVAGMCHFGAMQAASTTLPRSRSLDSLKTGSKLHNSMSHPVHVIFKNYSNRKYLEPITIAPHAICYLPHNTTPFTVYPACKNFPSLTYDIALHTTTQKALVPHEEHKRAK